MMSGPGDARRGPGREQPAVDGADLEDPEEVAEVGRHGREAAAVEGDDDRRDQHEDRGGGRADEGQQRRRAPCRRRGRPCRSACGRCSPTCCDHTNRPAMLNSDSRPDEAARGRDGDAGASPAPSRKKSWIIGLACSRMPMPAVTLQNSTVQSSQNCGVRMALAADTSFVGDQRLLLDRGRVEALGLPARRAGTRMLATPIIMITK